MIDKAYLERIRKQMKWATFYEKAFAEKVERVEVGAEVQVVRK